MNVEFSDISKEEFLNLDKELQIFFKNHLRKLSEMPPRRHMKFGVPHHVEDVTKQARLVYDVSDDTLFVIHCFASHKEYEKWFKSFK